MKITWLGQAGLLMETGGMKILIDPYLSDSVARVNPLNYRRVPVDKQFLEIVPDVIICTHNHLDHTDPETLKAYLAPEASKAYQEHGGCVTVLAPEAAWSEVRKFGGRHNYIKFNRHTQVALMNREKEAVRFNAVKAEHSDPHPIGVIVEAEGKQYYITGDTLYNTDIFEDIPEHIDVLFLPVNGVGNNMNMEDAARFCERIRPKTAVPMHCGLFDEIDMHAFAYENKIIPEIYREINLEDRV